MGADDDTDCVEHVWRLRGVVLDRGAELEYECTRCNTVTLQLGNQPFPQTT